MRSLLLYLFIVTQVTLLGQSFDIQLNNYKEISENEKKFLSFENCNYNENLIPFLSEVINGNISEVFLTNITSAPCSPSENLFISDFDVFDKPIIKQSKGISKNKFFSTINIYPFFLKNGVKHKLLSGTISYSISSISQIEQRSNEDYLNSVLNSGNWHKFSIPKTGIYELSYEKLVALGVISGPTPINQLAVFSNSTKMLPFIIEEERMQDLIELPTKIRNVQNSTFTNGSSILFYAEASNKEFFDNTDNIWKKEVNLYSDSNYVFITTSASSRKNINIQQFSNPTANLFDYNKITHHEKDWTNFIKSGRQWVGESFLENPVYFNLPYSPPILKPKRVDLKFSACARSLDYTDNIISAILNNDTIIKSQISKVSTVYYNDYVKFTTKSASVTNQALLSDENLNIQFYYHQTNNPLAWLDYFIVNSNERISTLNEDSIFIIPEVNNSITTINVKSDSDEKSIWDVSDLGNSFELNITRNDSGFTFNTLLDSTRKFICYNNQTYPSPSYSKPINNQNLHQAPSSNYVIITVPEFEDQAKRLIELHNRRDNLSGSIYFSEDIYNEFSSGRHEATAIRDFLKTLYDKGSETKDSLQYVLLFGDGSYDPKNRIENNYNPIPTFQSLNSIKLTSSYVTDDIYGLMDDNEGDYTNGDLLDLGVGRLPLKSTLEAEKVVDKITEYYNEYDLSDQSNYEKALLTSNGNWKNTISFIADDGDFNEHMRQADVLAENVDTTISNFNIKKIYLDAYPQENTALGILSPAMNEKLMKQFHEGSLIVNYTGHGGELGWTAEQVLLIKDIRNMENRNKLPLFMTATCEFSRFDNPEHTSAGEELILKPQGGAIALFTTVRLVFSIPNFKLNQTFYKVLESSIKESKTTIGDIFRLTKVLNNSGTNDRNFTLLGDPALRLAFPSKSITLDSVKINSNHTDTIKALSTPVIHGHINNNDGNLQSDFNGWIDILIFDKDKPSSTIGTEENSGPFNFTSRDDLLFNGRAKVVNGYFTAEVFIPAATRQNFDNARISFYALDEALGDASGFNENLIIGGTDSNAPIDESGPTVEIFLDDSTFSFGDNVSPTPIFIASLFDSSGINIIPNDIAKDITMTVDERSDLSYLLNEFYTPSTESFRKGEVIFPMDELEEGRHSLVFKAYDNQNNPSKAYTEFIIENNPKLALNHLLNYPNPFTTNTAFFFEHNQNSEDLEITISIYTISGKIVKTIEGIYNASNKRIGPIEWDGLDEFGDRIGRGVYIYKLLVKNANGEKEEAIQKLVLLR